MSLDLLHVVGARPNFPKLAPVYRAAAKSRLSQLIVHTGQHYDDALSGAFFGTLEMPPPDVNLEVGSSSHAVQTARVMERIEPVMVEHTPRWVVVYGDVNSTVAAALVAVKLGLPVAHVEAGLRSNDWSMPEEINRIVTDRLSSLLLTPSRDASEVLVREGERAERIVFVGNVMIDSLFHALAKARRVGFRDGLGIPSRSAVIVTLHRPSNVDDASRLKQIVASLHAIAEERPVVFPAHPRTRQRLDELGLSGGRIRLLEPVGYLEMLDLIDTAHAVVTDSGGLQEETTVLGVPCFTLRENTERPITITCGTNRLVRDLEQLPSLVRDAERPATPRVPEGWDGRAADRIARALQEFGRD
jgi:UDP-N-acetylglucosamine 2-epimerase (non-hydrolysing)